MTTAGNDTGTTREDAVLAGVYEQVIGARAEQYAAAYDVRAGQARLTRWLEDHAPTELELDMDADRAAAQLYATHSRSLLRLAALLVRDSATAEEVVQDAFVTMRGAWPRLRNAENGLAYLRQAVVNRARSVLRHRSAISHITTEAPQEVPDTEHGALDLLDRSATVAALRGLPDRQREAVVLHYYADLSEAQIAAAMGISRRAVKSHLVRGMSALRAALEQDLADVGQTPSVNPSEPLIPR